jgi:pimeloyl-ACP methyl ester carboxylesterase
MHEPMSLPRLMLVHGSGYAAWCWAPVLPFLDNLGLNAKAIDLPGHGTDTTPLSQVTLDSYAAAILNALDGPTVLLGHSAGGFAITAAAEQAPVGWVRGLIYLCAYVPAPGRSLVEMRRAAAEQPLRGLLHKAPDGLSYSFHPEHAGPLLFSDCDGPVAREAMARMGPEPIAPQATPLSLSRRSQSLPRHAILTRRDRTLPPDTQRAMVADWPEDRISWLETGHSPFLSAPEGLATVLARAMHAVSRPA